MKRLMVLAIFACVGLAGAARVTVDAGGVERIDTPVWISLEALGMTAETQNVGLVEITAEGRQRIPAQVDPQNGRLCWILAGRTPAGQTPSKSSQAEVAAAAGAASGSSRTIRCWMCRLARRRCSA